jgi:hypothetical protein
MCQTVRVRVEVEQAAQKWEIIPEVETGIKFGRVLFMTRHQNLQA